MVNLLSHIEAYCPLRPRLTSIPVFVVPCIMHICFLILLRHLNIVIYHLLLVNTYPYAHFRNALLSRPIFLSLFLTVGLPFLFCIDHLQFGILKMPGVICKNGHIRTITQYVCFCMYSSIFLLSSDSNACAKVRFLVKVRVLPGSLWAGLPSQPL